LEKDGRLLNELQEVQKKTEKCCLCGLNKNLSEEVIGDENRIKNSLLPSPKPSTSPLRPNSSPLASRKAYSPLPGRSVRVCHLIFVILTLCLSLFLPLSPCTSVNHSLPRNLPHRIIFHNMSRSLTTLPTNSCLKLLRIHFASPKNYFMNQKPLVLQLRIVSGIASLSSQRLLSKSQLSLYPSSS
jgi:hypothetical protein